MGRKAKASLVEPPQTLRMSGSSRARHSTPNQPPGQEPLLEMGGEDDEELLDPFAHQAVTMQDLNYRSRPIWIALGLTAVYFATGISYYTAFTSPRMSFVDALYFCVCTITTVGYGDSNEFHSFEEDWNLLLFTSFYVFLGVGIVGAALGIVLAWALDREEARALADVDDVEFEDVGCADGWGWFSSSHTDVVTGRHGSRNQANLLATFCTIGIILVTGTFGFHHLERVPLIKSFYWSCVTVTTVGYGDITPKTDEGKWFAIGYMMVGTFLMAKALADIASLPLEMRRLAMEQAVLKQYGGNLSTSELADIAGDRTFRQLGLKREDPRGCTKTEFVVTMLLRLDKIDKADVRRCAEAFHKLDKNNDYCLSEEDIKAAQLTEDVDDEMRESNTLV